jgi:predicted nucleic acid-binding Zn ribbon protein
MKKRSGNQQTLGDAIQEYLQTFKLEDKLTEIKLINSWEKIMGKTVAKYTREIYIRDKKLHLVVASAALREELLFSKEKIKDLMNKEAGKEVIMDVVLK